MHIRNFMMGDKQIKILSCMRLCWSYTEKIFRAKISSRDKFGVVVPNGAVVYGDTVDKMPV